LKLSQGSHSIQELTGFNLNTYKDLMAKIEKNHKDKIEFIDINLIIEEITSAW